jgi:Flp pilus assembly protein TadD
MNDNRGVTNSAPSPRQSLIVPALVVLVAVLAVFYPVLSFDFVTFDDGEHVARNPDFIDPSWAALARYWERPYFQMYVPVTYTVWMATAKAAHVPPTDGTPARLDPRAFHAVNLLVHAGAALAALALLRRLVADRWAATAGALVLALHPLQVETVAWISCLRDLLAGALGLLAIALYLRASVSPSSPSSGTPGEGRGGGPPGPESKSQIANCKLQIAATVALIAALLSKPTAIVVPPIAFAIDVAFLAVPWKRSARRLSIWLVLAIVPVVIARLAQPSSDLYRPPIWLRPIVALDAIGFYLIRLFHPMHLCVDYGRSPDWLIGHLRAAIGTIAAVGIGAIIVIIVKAIDYRQPADAGSEILRRPGSAARTCIVPFAIFLLALSPVLGLVTFDFQYFSTVADRYAYLAMLGPALAVAMAAARFKQWPSRAIIALAIATLAILSWRQTWTWQNTDALCRQAMAVNPTSLVARNLLASDAGRRGDFAEAIRQYRIELQTHPDDPLVHFYLGTTLLSSGDPRHAIDEFQTAVRGRPNDREARFYYALALIGAGNDAAAREQFEQAIRIAPDYVDAHANYGVFLLKHGDAAGAAREFRTTLELDPGNKLAHRGLHQINGD